MDSPFTFTPYFFSVLPQEFELMLNVFAHRENKNNNFWILNLESDGLDKTYLEEDESLLTIVVEVAAFFFIAQLIRMEIHREGIAIKDCTRMSFWINKYITSVKKFDKMIVVSNTNIL